MQLALKKIPLEVKYSSLDKKYNAIGASTPKLLLLTTESTIVLT